MRRNTWSTLSSLCRGESWIWSLFYLVYAHWAVCLLSCQTCALFLLQKTTMGGEKSLGTWLQCFLLLLLLWTLPSVPFRWGEKPQHLPTEKKKQTTCKVTKCSWLSGGGLLFSGIFFKSYDSQLAVTKSVVWISWSSFKHPYYYWLQSLGWSFLFLCTNSGYFRLHKYLKHVVRLRRNVYLLSFLWPLEYYLSRTHPKRLWYHSCECNSSSVYWFGNLRACCSLQKKKLCLGRHWAKEEYEGNWTKENEEVRETKEKANKQLRDWGNGSS